MVKIICLLSGTAQEKCRLVTKIIIPSSSPLADR